MTRMKNAHKNHNTGRHRSKRAIKRSTEGKVNNVKTLTKKNKLAASRDQRRNQSVQQRLKKREEMLMEKRKFGGESSAPILIAIVPLQDDVDLQTVLLTINGLEETNQAVVKENSQGITHISIPRLKKRFALVVPSKNNVLEALDVMKVASTVLFVIKDNIDEWGEEILKTSIPQKLPTTMVVFADKTDFSMTKNKTKKLRQQTTKLVEKYLPDVKTHSLNNSMDAYNLLRVLGEQEQQSIFYRKHRAHLMAEHINYCPENDESGTLKITGYLRGATLSVNGLVHVIGFGDFQMSQIDLPSDPYCLNTKGNMETDEVKVLERADPEKQESLEAENTPDPMDAEQTWPTAEELEEAKREQMEKKNTKRVPKGTSNYQAAWIIDDENDEAGDGDENDDEDEVEGEDGGEKMAVDKDDWDEDASQADEEYETMTVSEAPIDEQKYDEDMDLIEERQAMVRFKEAKEDAQFPDEVDTPQDIPARERFQKYRGLESFRTSPWDPKEDLPFDFGRIFQFKNFQRSTKLVFKENEVLIGAEPGSYITIHVKDVPKKLYDAYSSDGQRQLIVFGLLPNEHKMSLLNIVLKRTTDPEAQPIASKEKLIFQCGFRRFVTAPIFSEHTYTPKHKYLRFFQPGETAVASMFAPITFPQCPVLCFQQKKNELPKLVATGSILSANPDRLVIKRAVLSGHPFKVFKRSAVIRFMFYNREDIDWFKPVKLRTKYGRRGHIKEPLGTHGHMKCVFDGQLKSQDTILMNLFKRVYPKWTYEPCLYSTHD
ncbi:pre-rRNA-processing protein TSR1 homolog [Microplitis demolitor]|uniref:pre-rRNA-processing protein TSR1 homolog n=1 Tax=Microplitis demolitor TaxID=69319 RepID=UPI0004CD4AE4|nr:pre-rRNA-processing protein TSR1 homolog [Microplitis demolitor]